MARLCARLEPDSRLCSAPGRRGVAGGCEGRPVRGDTTTALPFRGLLEPALDLFLRRDSHDGSTRCSWTQMVPPALQGILSTRKARSHSMVVMMCATIATFQQDLLAVEFFTVL